MKFLIEKLPRDLAKAYRNDSSRRREMSHHNFFRDDDDIDYEKAEYKEITPEEAIALRKSGKAETIRALIGGDWVEYYKDGSANRNINISQWYSKLYKTKSGRIITNTQHMPFSHVMHIADKIYATNENETKIDPEKMKRRELTQDYEHPSKGSWYNHDYGDRIALHGNNRGSGDHTAMSDYRKRDYKNDLKKINELTQELKDLQAKYDAGDISRNKYQDDKEALKSAIDYYRKHILDYKKDLRDANDHYYKNYLDTISQDKLNTYRALKGTIDQSNQNIDELSSKLADIKSNGSNSDEYSYERKRLSQLKDQLAEIQRNIKYYEDKLSDAKTTADIAKAEKELNDEKTDLANAQADLNKLLKRNNQLEGDKE